MSTVWEDGWVTFDTETTGFGSDARVVEFGAVYFERGEPVHEWSTLIYPDGVNWSDSRVQEALSVNNLSFETLSRQPRFVDVMPNILLELSVPVLVAHNAEFDLRMLNQEFTRAGRAPLCPELVVCTCQLAASMTGRKRKLSYVAERYGVQQSGAHRATVDAEVCGRVLAEMMRRGEIPKERDALALQVKKSASLR